MDATRVAAMRSASGESFSTDVKERFASSFGSRSEIDTRRLAPSFDSLSLEVEEDKEREERERERDEAERVVASNLRNKLKGALQDLKTFSMLYAKGVLQRYPFLGEVAISLPVVEQEDEFSNSRSEDGSSSAKTSGVLPQISWGKVIGKVPDSAGKTAVAGSKSKKTPVFQVDTAKHVLRVCQEMLHIFTYDAFMRLCKGMNERQNLAWLDVLRKLAAAPPCAFGLGHFYCTPSEPGCTLRSREVKVGRGAEEMLQDVSEDAAYVLSNLPGDTAFSRASAVYSQALQVLQILPFQHSPLAKGTALCAFLHAVTTGASLEAQLVLRAKARIEQAADGERNGNDRMPLQKLAEWSKQQQGASAVGADDLMPRVCFCLVAAGLSSPFSDLSYLEECLPQESILGETGYAVVSFRGALSYLISMVKV
jgi:hypothetical protein